MKQDYTDAEFEVIKGEYRTGEESRTRPGWYYTGRRDARGNQLWYRPPLLQRRFFRRLALAVVSLGFLAAVAGMIFGG